MRQHVWARFRGDERRARSCCKLCSGRKGKGKGRKRRRRRRVPLVVRRREFFVFFEIGRSVIFVSIAHCRRERGSEEEAGQAVVHGVGSTFDYGRLGRGRILKQS